MNPALSPESIYNYYIVSQFNLIRVLTHSLIHSEPGGTPADEFSAFCCAKKLIGLKT